MRKVLIIAIAGLMTVGVAGCTPSTTPTVENVAITTPEPEESWSPKYVDIVGLEGETVTIQKGESVELVTQNTVNPNGWVPSTDNETVASVYNGSPNNFANVVIEGKEVGSATITVTNDVAGDVVTFGVKVKEG